MRTKAIVADIEKDVRRPLHCVLAGCFSQPWSFHNVDPYLVALSFSPVRLSSLHLSPAHGCSQAHRPFSPAHRPFSRTPKLFEKPYPV